MISNIKILIYKSWSHSRTLSAKTSAPGIIESTTLPTTVIPTPSAADLKIFFKRLWEGGHGDGSGPVDL